MTPALRAGAAALLAGVASAVLAGCGIDTRNPGASNTSTVPAGNQSTGTGTTPKPSARLPKPPKGVVRVEGPRQGSLTPVVVPKVQGVTVSFANVGESQGFADLCNGRIDVLDTSRLITKRELQVCARNGLQLTDNPIQVASDAVVIATRNESDVGGDCLRLSTVNDIFRAGSPISNWSQVGFFDIPLQTTGRESTSPTFQFFAQAVLGVPSSASLADVRADYLEHRTDGGVRKEVTNEARRQAVVARFLPRIKELRVERQIAFQAYVDAAINAARKRILDQIDRENKQRSAQKVTLTAEQKALIAQDNRRRVKRVTLAAQRRAESNFTFPRLTFVLQRARNALRRATIPGTIGIFRFSYYEDYENLLRPMEIWDPNTEAATLSGAKVIINRATTRTRTVTTPSGTTTTQTTTTPATGAAISTKGNRYVVDPDRTPWCVFPSQTTITNGSYPLARRLFLYVSKAYLKRPEVKNFLRTYLDNAQSLATSNRLVPIPDTVLNDDQNIVNGTQNPANGASGGTSTTATTQTTAATPPADQVPGVAAGGTSTAP